MLIPSLETSEGFDSTGDLNLNVTSRPPTAAPQLLDARHRPDPAERAKDKACVQHRQLSSNLRARLNSRPERVQGPLISKKDTFPSALLLPAFFAKTPVIWNPA